MPLILDMSVVYNKIKPKIVIALNRGDAIAVRLATESFPGAPRIDKVTIHDNHVDENGVGSPGKEICSWTRDGANGCEKYYAITSSDETHVELADSEQNTSTETHWFGVSGTFEDKQPWEADPELINRPGGLPPA